MAGIKSWALWCDDDACSDADSFSNERGFERLADLRAEAQASGWSHVDRRDFCADHGRVQPVPIRKPRGVCQGCGGTRRVCANGTIGKHNRLTKQRYSLGVCPGTGHPPKAGTVIIGEPVAPPTQPVNPRGTCTGCGQNRMVRRDGTIGRHTDMATRSTDHLYCKGTDEPPLEATL